MFFRAKDRLFLKSISCLETGRGAAVELIARGRAQWPYEDVRVCSLPENERGILCRKSCLTSTAVRDAPYIAFWKVQAGY
jgi:hypothetical protein